MGVAEERDEPVRTRSKEGPGGGDGEYGGDEADKRCEEECKGDTAGCSVVCGLRG
jgi:hypothetical protein